MTEDQENQKHQGNQAVPDHSVPDSVPDSMLTPGPWEVNDHVAPYLTVTGKDGVVVPSRYLDSKGRCRADYNLIAAAPDLLRCLEWYVENDDAMEGNETWLAGREAARAAIAKAKGGGR